ncbi:type IX secretion system sortase PorU [Dokdonia sp. Hel_I_53]|uniref:type IX secretion system sortase PorU n=1 Tax=Dokdonia sp. Hel_I_53 TaxID=1566287 RepID=UPI0011992D9C|nr:type IX secretion system sortase PorU [Dokdonia sp. Hel_I_53]TVZ53136.1 putative secreted protein (Por secretion system target) [Dokdonia sp. Hel_I_53]
MKLLFTCLIFFATNLYAQKDSFSIQWESSKNDSEKNGERLYLHLTESEEGVWSYQEQWLLPQPINASSTKLVNISYEPVPRSWLSKLNPNKVPNEPRAIFATATSRSDHYAVVKFSPFVKQNGQIYRVVSGEVDYAFAKAQPTSYKSSLPITNSILANENLYKFYVENTGVHRIDREFLSNLGVNTNAINPQRIKVYGLGGSPLPLRNSDNNTYDLREIPVQVTGEEDGSFDSNDDILFYGESTYKYHEELNTHINPYSNKSYYYITVEGANGLRVQPYTEPVGTQVATFSTYDQYAFHEEDNTNIVRIGRRWFGERFNFETNQSFEFSLPNAIPGEIARLKVVVAAVSESATSFDISVNGVVVGTIPLAAISTISLARGNQIEIDVPINSQSAIVTLTYNNNGNPSSTGYLDYISLDVPSQLTGTGDQFIFKNNSAAAQSGIGAYELNEMQEYTQIWEVTDQTDIRALPLGGSPDVVFKSMLGSERKFVAVTTRDYFLPLRESGNSQVTRQNLKGTVFQGPNGTFEDVDYLMVTSNLLRPQAERLAQHNRLYRGLNVKTVTLEEIYEEFGGGRQDIGAIRNFIKYVYDNASSDVERVKYVCLFGDTSVDYKDRIPANNNVMPTFQTYESFSLVSSFMSDDFYGSMDPDEGTMRSTDRLDIAVGRIVADTPQLAATIVDKIINYNDRSSYGRWRNNFVLVSDDVDEVFEFTELQGTLDDLGDQISMQKPFVNVYKIHSDAFRQQSSAGGNRYPKVNEAIANAIEVGSLVVTYLGHGGEELLASEAIVTQNDIDRLDNGEKLPLIVTVTCEFGKFDNPERPTGGERLLWNPNGGAVGMVTTTREISVSLGVQFNNVLAGEIFSFGSNVVESVAENLRASKNTIPNGLRRVIFFCGDPAMKLAFPKPDIQLTAINDIAVGTTLPELKALDLVKMSGRVLNESGQILSDYSGTLAVTLFDKRIERQTLGNDGTTNGAGELLIMDFTTLGAILYRGQASVTNGNFEFTFRMPRDTSIPLGNGRLNFYAERTGALEDQTGVNMNIIVGGLNENAPEDNEGPKISLFMNDENFVDGGITNDSPIILAKLEDENGINTASGIGHDMIAIIDGDETNPIVLNDFYETDVDDFMKGTAARKLRDLESGLHTLSFKAWDVYNNSSTAELQFVVAGNEELEINNVLNYPNPFVNYTEFWFNHNRPFEPLDVQVQIFTVTGKVIKTINQSIVTDGFLSRDITWNGLDDFGQALGKGVYVYKITVKSTLTNKQVEKIEKLVIL